MIQYNQWMSLQKYSINTIKQYTTYQKLIQKKGELSQEALDDFIYQHNNSVARSFLKNYIAYLSRYKIVHAVILRNLMVPKLIQRTWIKQPNVLTKQQINTLISNMIPSDQLLCLIMYEGGLRASEVSKLKKSQIDLNMREIKGYGKGNKPYTIYFSEKTKQKISEHIKDMEENERLFPNRSRCTIWKKIRAQAEYHKIMNNEGKYASPHWLRHSIATHMSQNGADLREIQIYLRHSKLETVKFYVNADENKIRQKVKNTIEN